MSDGCTDPDNCKRCRTMPQHRGEMHHAGIPTETNTMNELVERLNSSANGIEEIVRYGAQATVGGATVNLLREAAAALSRYEKPEATPELSAQLRASIYETLDTLDEAHLKAAVADELERLAAALSRAEDETKRLHAILSAVMDVEKAEPTGDPYDPTSWASSAKSVVAGSEHDRVRAERDRAEAAVTAWSDVVGGIEAHIQDRIAMGDDANPQTYLEIIQADVRDVKRSSEQMIASRWASEKRLRDALSRAEAQRDALGEQCGIWERSYELVLAGQNGALEQRDALAKVLLEISLTSKGYPNGSREGQAAISALADAEGKTPEQYLRDREALAAAADIQDDKGK